MKEEEDQALAEIQLGEEFEAMHVVLWAFYGRAILL